MINQKEKRAKTFSADPESLGPYNNRNHSTKDWVILLIWILGVIAIGMFAVNQTLEFRYKAEFLKAPCKLCLELNPEVSEQCFIKEEKLYPNGLGGWRFENGSEYKGYVPSRSSPSGS